MSSPDTPDIEFPDPTNRTSPADQTKPVRVFFMTRFMGTQAPYTLLSLGFAADTGQELNVVIDGATTQTPDAQSPEYAKIRPMLEALPQENPEILDREAAARRIAEWLDELRAGAPADILELMSSTPAGWDVTVRLITDCDVSLDLFRKLFRTGTLLSNSDGLLADQVFSGSWMQRFVDLRHYYHQHEGRDGNPENALDAARGIRSAWDMVFDAWD